MGQPPFIFVLRNNKLTFTIMEKRTERRKHFLHTNVAGFMYWDGCEAFSRLEIGTKLEMVREADNKRDCDAVALYYKDYRLGFIPGSENEIFAQFLDMGHSDLLVVLPHHLGPSIRTAPFAWSFFSSKASIILRLYPSIVFRSNTRKINQLFQFSVIWRRFFR